MRKFGSWAFQATDGTEEGARSRFLRLVALVEAWVEGKGTISGDKTVVQFIDGRRASLQTEHLDTEIGTLKSCRLAEPISSGEFVTEISVALSATTVAVTCDLSAGSPATVVAPMFVDAHCPHVLRQLLNVSPPWFVGWTPVPTVHESLSGDGGANRLITLLRASERTLPVVVISELDTFVLHPSLPGALARDLAGLAVVVTIDAQASWGLTSTIGKEWSCFNGAVRLYWPRLSTDTSPFRHPLWTADRLMRGMLGTDEAAQRIRGQLRRRIMGISTITVSPAQVFQQIRDAHIHAERLRQETTLKENLDYKGLAELYARDNADLETELRKSKDLIRELRQDLWNAQLEQEWSVEDALLIAPDTSTPPSTVSEAFERAKRLHVQFLTFGDDVETGVADLAPDAGPPDKVLRFLEGLADYAESKRAERLGCGTVAWFKERNMAASEESDTTKNNKEEMARRRWHDGRSQREFNLHLKPSEATSPSRCVRIYFDWDEASQKVVVGWIGRHP